MISKNQIKFIKSLEQKKYRKEYQCFVAEGPKLVGDILPHFHCRLLAATAEWLQQNAEAVGHIRQQQGDVVEISQQELEKISFLKTPQEVLAVCRIPVHEAQLTDVAAHKLCLALDDVQDPGNLGTIVRLADWFGIEDIFCSAGTADLYNPKTVQATMGALARVRVLYLPLLPAIREAREQNIPVYGTLLEGNNIYKESVSNRGVLIMGNEGKGLSPEIRSLVTHRLFIPHYPADRSTSESLNVAIATAIVCAEFRRRETEV